MSNFVDSKAYPWALVGIFAAFHTVMSLIPYSVLGTGGGFITWGMISAPVIGFLLGPIYGAISVFIGSLLGVGVFNLGGILGPIVPTLAPTACAISVGSFREMKMWVSPLFLAVSTLLYLVSPIGEQTIIYVWLFVVMFLVNIPIIIPPIGAKLYSLLDLHPDLVKPLTAPALFLVILTGLIVDSSIGSAITVYYLVFVTGFNVEALAAIYLPITFVYPIERFIGAFIATLVVSAVSISAIRIGLGLPLRLNPETEILELDEDIK